MGMGSLPRPATRAWWPSFNLGWKALATQCASSACSSKFPKLHGLLRSGDGVRMFDRWYCGARCFERAIVAEFRRSIAFSPTVRGEFQHRMPLGLLMVSRGVVEHAEVKDALALQAKTGAQIGVCLRKIANIPECDVANALGAQWSCPVFRGTVDAEAKLLVPRHLLGQYRMLPVHSVRLTRDLYVGFRQRVDRTALYAIEQMLQCHTIPCILEESLFDGASAFASDNESRDLVVDNAASAEEMARIATSYAQQLHACEVRMVDCGDYVWVRVRGAKNTANLLFRRDCQRAASV